MHLSTSLRHHMAAEEHREADQLHDTSLQVDNMFAPNAWESYCSALGSNINCIGLLLVSCSNTCCKLQKEGRKHVSASKTNARSPHTTLGYFYEMSCLHWGPSASANSGHICSYHGDSNYSEHIG